MLSRWLWRMKCRILGMKEVWARHHMLDTQANVRARCTVCRVMHDAWWPTFGVSLVHVVDGRVWVELHARLRGCRDYSHLSLPFSLSKVQVYPSIISFAFLSLLIFALQHDQFPSGTLGDDQRWNLVETFKAVSSLLHNLVHVVELHEHNTYDNRLCQCAAKFLNISTEYWDEELGKKLQEGIEQGVLR